MAANASILRAAGNRMPFAPVLIRDRPASCHARFARECTGPQCGGDLLHAFVKTARDRYMQSEPSRRTLRIVTRMPETMQRPLSPEERLRKARDLLRQGVDDFRAAEAADEELAIRRRGALA